MFLTQRPCDHCKKEMIVDLDELINDASVGLCAICFPMFYKRKVEVYKHDKCECGAEKAGAKYHADWCDMWKDPMTGKNKWQLKLEKWGGTGN